MVSVLYQMQSRPTRRSGMKTYPTPNQLFSQLSLEIEGTEDVRFLFPFLTKKEANIAFLKFQGYKLYEIADIMGISQRKTQYLIRAARMKTMKQRYYGDI